MGIPMIVRVAIVAFLLGGVIAKKTKPTKKPPITTTVAANDCQWTFYWPNFYSSGKKLGSAKVPTKELCVRICAGHGSHSCRSVNYDQTNGICDFLPDTANDHFATNEFFIQFKQGSHYFDNVACKNAITTPPTSTLPTTTTPAELQSSDDNYACGLPEPGNEPKTANVAMKKMRLGSSRIVGGREANKNSWPSQVALLRYRAINCGGTLIAPDIVLTAAHCLHNKSPKYGNLTVVAGKHQLKAVEAGQQERTVTQQLIHADYNPETYVNDLALLKLSSPFELSETVRLMCLPSAGEADLSPGTLCVVSGWGTLEYAEFESPTLPDPLQEAVVPVVSEAVCNDASHYQGQLHTDVMMCAGYSDGGIDSCQGDSGGPLVCKGPNSWVLRGVVSFGIGCASAEFPGIYVKVAKYVDWIEEKSAQLRAQS